MCHLSSVFLLWIQKIRGSSNYHINTTVFVIQDGADFVCHSEKCKEKRAVHMASEATFACDHMKLVKSHSYPSSAKNLTEEDIFI